MRKLVVQTISLYQKTLSPDHGWRKHQHPYGYCRYYPSCSEYARQSISRHGVLRGGTASVWRVLRCNPWAKPAIDLPKGAK
jgi:putative membrane protein insertion efficiency factor